jgi:hypothetical protein
MHRLEPVRGTAARRRLGCPPPAAAALLRLLAPLLLLLPARRQPRPQQQLPPAASAGQQQGGSRSSVLLSQQRDLGSAAGEDSHSKLVVYAYLNQTLEDISSLQFFIQQAVLQDDSCDYLLLLPVGAASCSACRQACMSDLAMPCLINPAAR